MEPEPVEPFNIGEWAHGMGLDKKARVQGLGLRAGMGLDKKARVQGLGLRAGGCFGSRAQVSGFETLV